VCHDPEVDQKFPRLAAPNSTRATSLSRSTDPSGFVRTTMLSNSPTELSRPWLWMLSCSCCSSAIGHHHYEDQQEEREIVQERIAHEQ
jgi:hypothetical protein